MEYGYTGTHKETSGERTGKGIRGSSKIPIQMTKETERTVNHCQAQETLTPVHSNICQAGNILCPCERQISKTLSMIPAHR